MNTEAMQAKLIDAEIRAACLEAGADPTNEGLIENLRREAIAVESGDSIVVAAKLSDGVAKLSNSTAISDTTTPMSLSELLSEWRAEGRFGDAFSKAEPDTKSPGNGKIEGFTHEEFLRLQPGEMLNIAKKVDPEGRLYRDKPQRREAARQANSGTVTEAELFGLSPAEALSKARGL